MPLSFPTKISLSSLNQGTLLETTHVNHQLHDSSLSSNSTNSPLDWIGYPISMMTCWNHWHWLVDGTSTGVDAAAVDVLVSWTGAWLQEMTIVASAVRCADLRVSLTFSIFPNFSLTTLEFPDFARFSRWVVTLKISARSRKWSTRYALPKFFYFLA